jgi:uncharacterized protein YybS (DUF2232 family)
MGVHEGAKQGKQVYTILTVLLAAAFLLPGLAPSLFGWISGLLAIPVFCLLSMYGTRQGTILVRNGAILAAVAAIIANQLPNTLFSMSLIPLGYSFNRSEAVRENELRTCFKGFIVLGVSWLIFWSAYGTVHGINPYNQLLQVLDTGFSQTYELYSENSEIPAETQVDIEQAVTELRAAIPKILPGILACTVLLTVWINLLGSISLLERLAPGRVPWKKYRDWRLPDRLIWMPIGAGIALIAGDGIVSSTGFSFVLISALLYFFQGLAVFINFMDRWNVPIYLKILIYGILILQSYGLLLLSVIGIADVWFNFRNRLNRDDHANN